MISAILNVSIVLIIIFVLVIIYILPVIASWCLFKKAEIPGWKALIPIYNLCLIFNMCGMSEWCAAPILLSSIANIVAKNVISIYNKCY